TRSVLATLFPAGILVRAWEGLLPLARGWAAPERPGYRRWSARLAKAQGPHHGGYPRQQPEVGSQDKHQAARTRPSAIAGDFFLWLIEENWVASLGRRAHSLRALLVTLATISADWGGRCNSKASLAALNI